MTRAVTRALAVVWDRLGRALGVDAYVARHVHAALAQGDAEFEQACRDAVDLTRDGLPVPTTSEIDAMISEIAERLRHEARGGSAT